MASPAALNTPIKPGDVLKHYRVIRELNRGGSAVVYEGDDVRTGEKVALKVLSLRDKPAGVPLSAIKRELQYGAALQHDNIVGSRDHFVTGAEQLVIVMQLISGPDCLDLLNECGGRLEEARAAPYFAQLARGVEYIHTMGLCHRDIKPENCVIDRASGVLKIIDFGLTASLISAVTLGVGTPDYMAPELLAGGNVETLYSRRTGVYDPRASDVWAMGVLLDLLVTGQYPFEDPCQPQNVVATLQNIVSGRRKPFPSRLSPQCCDLITGMLRQDPAQRLTLQQIAAHPWLALHGVAAPSSSSAAAAPLPLPPAPLSYAAAASLLGDGVVSAADVAGSQLREGAGGFASSALAPALAPCWQPGPEPEESGHFVSAESSAALSPRAPSFAFMVGAPSSSPCPATPKLLAPHPQQPQQAQQAAQQQQRPPLPPQPAPPTAAPSAIAAVRPPAHPPLVHVLIEGPPSHPGLKAVVPAQSLEGSPTANEAKKARMAGRGSGSGGLTGWCRLWFVGRSSCSDVADQ